MIDLRERLTGLINKIDKDMDLGQGSEVAQLVSMLLGLHVGLGKQESLGLRRVSIKPMNP